MRVEIDDIDAVYVAKGPQIEEPLIQFLLDNEYDTKAKLEDREIKSKMLF